MEFNMAKYGLKGFYGQIYDFMDFTGMATITCRGLDHETYGLYYNLIQV